MRLRRLAVPLAAKPDNWQRAAAIASLLSVLAVGAGLVVTNKYNREQQELALQGQITDRFTKAIEQLGQTDPQKIDVRLGAIYALQRIMRDSATDQPAVVDVLSAFVRVHAPRDHNQRLDAIEAPPVDIQAALTVLIRRDPTRDGESHVDLSETDLDSANLADANLAGADLSRTTLIAADLSRAKLPGADLIFAQLDEANLVEANLVEANLVGSDLQRAKLTGADLTGADLSGAFFSRANVYQAKFRDAKLHPAELDRAIRASPTPESRLGTGVSGP